MALVTKNFSDIITFTRASTATYFNSAGVLTSAAIAAPRFDYNPATLAARGLLIEEQRTNSLTYSEDLTQAAWVKSATTVTSNAVVSPSGAQTADVLIADTANSEHVCDQSFSAVAGTTYTISAFVKANGLTDIGLRFTVASLWTGSVSPQVRFDLSSATTSTITGTPSASSITFVGNGWYRVSMSVACTTNGTPSARLQLMSGSANVFAGNGINGVTIWGAQVEAGAFPTSYIPTTTTALTRSADVASVNTLSPWFNATEGTIYFEGGIPSNYSSGFPTFYSFNDSTANNNIQPAANASADVLNVEMKVAGSVVAGFYVAYVSGTTKLAFAYKLNDVNYAKDGAVGTTDTSAAIPNITQVNLGSNQTPGNFLNGYLRRVAYYPRRLSNAELVSITT